MFALRSKNVLIENRFVPADVCISENKILSISKYGSVNCAIDLQEKKILPGIVDLHSDAIEKEVEPRPGARFPLKNAIAELDKKLAVFGITTMFHAVGFNDDEVTKDKRGTDKSRELVETIYHMNKSSYLSVDNFVHARFEITSVSSIETLKELINNKKLEMLSIMDHSPGQGQFKSLEAWKKYHIFAYGDAIEDIDAYIKKKLLVNKTGVVEDLVKFAKRYNLPVLSHDDDCIEKVNTLKALGVSASEFPLSVEVAEYARNLGMHIGMGAPNVVRGKSQSGNISASMLIKKDLCDYLCSDYHPSSMLMAIYKLKDELNIPIEKGFDMISLIPAKIAGLNGRGEILDGKLADLIVVDENYVPSVCMTVKKGKIVYNCIKDFLKV